MPLAPRLSRLTDSLVFRVERAECVWRDRLPAFLTEINAWASDRTMTDRLGLR